MQKITLNEQRLHDKQAACFFTLLFDLGGGGHLLPTREHADGSALKPREQKPQNLPVAANVEFWFVWLNTQQPGGKLWEEHLEDLHLGSAGGVPTASRNENIQGFARFPCPQHPNFPTWCQNPSCPS